MTTYDLVRQFKGVTVWKFSQSSGEVSLRLGHKGVCSALGASWINYHAHNDSLAKHLQLDEHGELDALTLQSVMHLQQSFVDTGIELAAVETWLEMHGMVPLNMDIKSSVYKDTEFHIITSLGKVYNCYAYVIFGRSKRGGSHAVAVWIGGPDYTKGDICFFEPNYGEFWFEKKQNFFCFFPAYYQRQRMKMDMTDDEICYVIFFALSNRAL